MAKHDAKGWFAVAKLTGYPLSPWPYHIILYRGQCNQEPSTDQTEPPRPSPDRDTPLNGQGETGPGRQRHEACIKHIVHRLVATCKVRRRLRHSKYVPTSVLSATADMEETDWGSVYRTFVIRKGKAPSFSEPVTRRAEGCDHSGADQPALDLGADGEWSARVSSPPSSGFISGSSRTGIHQAHPGTPNQL